MKKSIFALAITGALALTAAQADTVLYGSIRYGVDVASNHGNNTWSNDYYVPTSYNWWAHAGSTSAHDRQWPAYYNAYNMKDRRKKGLNVRDVGSRIGLMGGEELGNGIKVVYKLEWGFDGVEGLNNGGGFQNRIAMLGLATEFGTFAIGRLDNPFKQGLQDRSEADDFNGVGRSAAMAAAGEVFFGAMGSLNTFDANMLERVGNAVAYISPTWGGFSFNVAAIMDEGYGNSGFGKKKTLDFWTLNLNYAHESGFYINAGYITGDISEKRAHAYGMQVGFDNEQWGVNLQLARGQNKGAGNLGVGNNRSGAYWAGTGHDGAYYNDLGNNSWSYSTQNSKHTSFGWDVGGHFSFGPDYASTVRMTVGQAKADKKSTFSGGNGGFTSLYSGQNKETNKMTTWALGFEQKLSNRTRVWIEYENSSVKQKFRSHGVDVSGNTYDAYNTNFAGSLNRDGTYNYDERYFRSKKYKDDKINIGIRHDF